MLDLNQLINTAIANSIELAVREQLTPYILRIDEMERMVSACNVMCYETQKELYTYTSNVNSKLEETVCLATVRDIVNEVISHDTPASTQIDPDTLAEAVSNALDDKMDAICERVAKDIDLHGAMRDFIKNEVTISLDTY